MNAYTPYLEFERDDWAALNGRSSFSLTEEEFERLKGFNDPVRFEEVEQVYVPLAGFLEMHANAFRRLHGEASSFFRRQAPKVPYIVGIAGSVAAGKSTTARLLRALLSRRDPNRTVDLVTTDGFLYPNRVLQQRGLMNKKGFPISYDRKRLIRFLTDVKAGKPEASAPVYSHLTYDIVPDEQVVVRNPDILIVEGINILQVYPEAPVSVSDFFDFSIYVDAEEQLLQQWYVDRFLMLRRTAFRNPSSYFHRYADLTEEEAVRTACRIWRDINAVNLRENILPTKGRAHMVLEKGPDHAVRRILIRKL